MYYFSSILIVLVILTSSNTYAADLEVNCKSMEEAALSILANHADDNFAHKLIEYSKSNPVDNDCYRWQLVILNDLRKLSLEPLGYREYIFNRVKVADSDFQSDFMLHVFRYILASTSKELSEQEWLTVKNSLRVSSEMTVLSVMLGLVASAAEDDVELQKKMADLFSMAKGGKLAEPELITLSRAVELFLTVTIEHRPDLFTSYYNKYFYLLDESGMNNIAAEVIASFYENQNEVGLTLIETFVKNVSEERGVDKKMFSLLYKIHKEKEFSKFYNHVVTVLVENSPDKIRAIILNANLNRMKKDLLILEYKLDKPGEYLVENYANQLFDEQIRKQKKAAEYLLAFGPRSVVIKQDVITKLIGLQTSNDKISSSDMIVSLLKVLENIGAQDQNTLDVLLWALADTDPKISQQAKSGLESIGIVAMPEYNRNFKTYSVKVQALVIEVMGSFDSGKLTAIKFLSRVKPRNDKMKFAIEDAVAELNAF